MIENASLAIVGSGIKFISHLTHEAKAYIDQSDKVLYLVNEPLMKEWIQKRNPNSESLDFLYSRYHLRSDCYNAITKYILDALRQIQHVCVVLYGHPTVFSEPGLNAVVQAKKEGYYAKILPGISAADCLFSDLFIDPGSSGCQSFETTDFLLYQRKFDPRSHLLLWQADIIGVLSNPLKHNNKNGLNVLVEYLIHFYSLDHEIILYEAAQYPQFESVINKVTLGQLPDVDFSPITILYVPPLSQSSCNTTILHKLKMNDFVCA